jgi:hypothetical protein
MTTLVAAAPAGATMRWRPTRAYFTSQELANIAGCREALVRQYRRDGVFPTNWYGPEGYAPVCLAMVEAVEELGLLFGENSPIPKDVARQTAHAIERAWQSPEAASVALHIEANVDGSKVTISGPMQFLARARQKLASFAAA